jgi:hypothetical protein
MRERSREGMYDKKFGYGRYITGSGRTEIEYYGQIHKPPFHSLATQMAQISRLDTLPNGQCESSEFMQDVGGPQKYEGSGKKRWNQVLHEKTMYYNPPVRMAGVKGTQLEVAGGRFTPPSSAPDLPVLGLYEQAQLYTECYNELLPQLEGAHELANFIWEMKDFRSLFKLMRRSHETAGTFTQAIKSTLRGTSPPKRGKFESTRSWKNRRGEYNRKVHFDPTMPAAEMQLTHQYAIMPFIRDVAAMSYDFGNVKRKVDRLNLRGSMVATHNAQRVYSDYLGGTGYSSGYPGMEYTLYRGEYHLEGEMTYRLRKMSEHEQWLTYMGLTGKASRVWNAIPFTFVIDHYTNMAKVMQSFDRTDIDTKMSRMIESVNAQSSTIRTFRDGYYDSQEWFLGNSTPSPSAKLLENYIAREGGTREVCSAHRLSYWRNPLTTFNHIRPPVLPTLKIPGLKQLANDLALTRALFGR